MTRYLLDANVFIQAKNLHYGFDICPGFWEWLAQANAQGIVSSVEQVKIELLAGKDQLANWARKQGSNMFLRPGNQVVQQFGNVMAWVNGPNRINGRRYEPAAISTFAQAADPWLVARALACGGTVVTHEVPANTPRRVKIPNVCAGLGVRFMNPFQMLRLEGVQFRL